MVASFSTTSRLQQWFQLWFIRFFPLDAKTIQKTQPAAHFLWDISSFYEQPCLTLVPYAFAAASVSLKVLFLKRRHFLCLQFLLMPSSLSAMVCFVFPWVCKIVLTVFLCLPLPIADTSAPFQHSGATSSVSCAAPSRFLCSWRVAVLLLEKRAFLCRVAD